MERIKVGIGKLGKSILFDETKWGAIGGDCDAPMFFQNLIHRNPHVDFIIIGKSDFSRLDFNHTSFLNKHKNVYDAWAKAPSSYDEFYLKHQLEKSGIELDCCLIFGGPVGNSNLKSVMRTIGKDKKYERHSYRKSLEMFQKYAAPIIRYLNDSDVPWIHLVTDPRYCPSKAQDLFNRPDFTMSQFYDGKEARHIKNYRDYEERLELIHTVEKIEYTGLEKIFLMGRERPRWDSMKVHDMVIVLNEGGNGGLSRGPILDTWLFNGISPDFNNVEVYGKWSDDYIQRPNFKGSKPFKDLEPILRGTRFTFIVPIDIGWVTSKIWEMIYFGIVPFLHPYYDNQCHIPLPEICRPGSPQELVHNYNTLREDDAKRQRLVQQLQDLIDTRDLDGSDLNSFTMELVGQYSERMLRDSSIEAPYTKYVSPQTSLF